MGYTVTLLGAFQVSYAAAPVTGFQRAKVQAFLAYLAIECGRPHRRSKLAGLLWPDLPEADALRNLTQALVRLRAALAHGDDPVRASRATVQWRAEAAAVDVVEFVRLAGSAEPADLEQAATLYQGELLAGFALPGCEAFEEWLLLKREELREQALRVLQTLSEWYRAAGRAAEAAVAASRQLALDPWREAAHRQLMHALAAGGDQAAALAAYARCVAVLRDDLGVTPGDETARLAERIRAGDPALRSAPPTRLTLPPRLHNLPAALTPLLGREVELADLVALPDAAARLVTIVGAGGVGKTRLALDIAWALRSRFSDGVWWVPLAGVQASEDPALQATTVVGVIAAALDLTMDRQVAPLDALAEHLRERTMLVVLDNCEHLPELGGVTRMLLETAPALRVLATSREPLGIGGEALRRLGGLAVPAGDVPDPAGHAGVRLFLDHARRRSPGWGQDPRELAGAVRLCRLLDGLPLGIELAAPWVEHYAPDEIGDALQTDLDFLAARTRDLPDRHRSLRAAFEYTWHLLTAGEQRALARLAVFQGSFDRAAAHEVAGTQATTLVRLVDKSLLSLGGTGRYALHELLRQFAAERLAGDPEAAVLPGRHAAYYLALAEQATPELTGPGRATWFPRLEAEHDNLRAALAWARTQPQADTEMRLAGALGRFWLLRGYVGEGREWVEHALTRRGVSAAPCRVRARLCEAGGMLLCGQGDRARGEQLFEQSIALYRAAGDTAGEVNVRILLAGVAYDYAEFSRAVAIWESCVQLARAIDHPEALLRSLSNLGAAWYYMGDLERAAASLEESLVLSRRAGRADSVAVQLSNLGNVARRKGDLQRADAYLKEALALSSSLNDPRRIAAVLERLAAAAATGGRMERAAHLLGAAHQIQARLGLVRAAAESAEIDQTAAVARRALGEATWSAQFAAGSALTIADAIAYALQA
ncbi:MAG TPA: BTAD domain-containing putative transcriptional regulator [Thermomicrobiales bacterium]|nr:BTAD domain-containing putative transcriptional regulator [Thermomicrobiales bacterium]